MGKKNKIRSGSNQASPSKTEAIVGTNFKLEIPDDVFQKIMWWINKSELEVSGFGHLDYDEKSRLFTVRDAIILKQKVAQASTEIDPSALAKAIYETRNEPNALKWHWHSHVNMNVFWSGDDRELIRSLAHQGWILATVFNKRHEMRTAFSEVTTVFGNKHEVFIDEIPTYTQRYLPNDLCKQWDKEYEGKVEEEKVSYGSYGYGNDWTYETGKGWIRGSDQLELDEVKKKEIIPISEKGIGKTPSAYMGINSEVEFDDCGLARIAPGVLIYNPVYDDTLKDFDDVLDAIERMDPEDIEWCRKNDPEFQEYYRAFSSREDEPNGNRNDRGPALNKAT